MGISRAEALECFRSDDLIGIGMAADAVRRRLHPEGVVGYVVEREVDCGGSSRAGSRDAGVEAVCGLVVSAREEGGTGIVLGNAAGLGLGGWEQVLMGVKRRFPLVAVRGLNAASLRELGVDEGLSVRETVERLGGAGLDSVGGDGAAEVGTEAWVEVHRAAHAAGMRTCAEMVFGAGEGVEARVDFLKAVGRLQEETGGFAAFAPVSFRGDGRELEDATAVERLKTLAIFADDAGWDGEYGGWWGRGWDEGVADGAAVWRERCGDFGRPCGERGGGAAGDSGCGVSAGGAGWGI